MNNEKNMNAGAAANSQGTRAIDIKGMTGDVCVGKVRDALEGLRGVETKSVEVGEAQIRCVDASACQAACAAIQAAGFEATDTTVTTTAIASDNMVAEGGAGNPPRDECENVKPVVEVPGSRQRGVV